MLFDNSCLEEKIGKSLLRICTLQQPLVGFFFSGKNSDEGSVRKYSSSCSF